MKQAGFALVTLVLLAGCASAPSGRTALVGQPLRTAVEAIGYLPDERQVAADARTYVWELGSRRKGTRFATAGTEAPSMVRKCTVEVTTDPENVIRRVDLKETRGGCADVNRKLRLAAS